MFGNKGYMTEEQVAAFVQPLRERVEQLEELIGQQAVALQALRAEMDRLGEAMESRPVLPSSLSASLSEDGARVERGAEKVHAVASTWFFSTPSPEGSFSGGTAEETVGKSIYQLRTDDGVNGRFVMLSSPDAIATAMISVSQFVKPVCRIEGNTHRQPQHIETLEEGVAQLTGDVWKVVKKATVQFV